MNYNQLSNGTILSLKKLARKINNENIDVSCLNATEIFNLIQKETLICFNYESNEMKNQCVELLKEVLNIC